MKNLIDRIEKLWCMHMHDGVMWPFRGQYRCSVCFREYPVPFEGSLGTASERRAVGFARAVALEKA